MSTSLRSIRRAMRSKYGRREMVTDRSGVTKGITWRDDGFPFMQSVLPEGESGDVSISHFTISEKAADSYNLSIAFTPGTGLQRVEPGKYVRMHVGERVVDNLMMSDTPMERRTNWEVRREAHGRVLIAGLGIGMILHPLLDPLRTKRKFSRAADSELPAVDKVIVIEKSPHVIKLVKPSLERYGDRLEVIEADIFAVNHKLLGKFDTIYFDIWPHITQDNLPEMAKLHQRWKYALNRGAATPPWMSSWMVDHLRAERESDRRSSWW